MDLETRVDLLLIDHPTTMEEPIKMGYWPVRETYHHQRGFIQGYMAELFYPSGAKAAVNKWGDKPWYVVAYSAP